MREMMELNKKMMVNVALLLFLMGFSAIVEACRQLDPSYDIAQLNNIGDASYSPGSSTKECCNTCSCIVFWPNPIPICSCKDVAESCPASCKSCYCTKSDPPQCRCMNFIVNKCYIPTCN